MVFLVAFLGRARGGGGIGEGSERKGGIEMKRRKLGVGKLWSSWNEMLTKNVDVL